ncbi:winged helix-turn-helix domain-containing protein [Nocardiopsis aegyptia]|uniref:Transposase n=1 Tax=Nocardiopsis aegyptia TaxID=220378 RepID=A0A7Z0J879_9ACTN|nr:winged helix-turn-helix domain-containing protein [Nocardiopsis aegyptia]NYJ32823.1 transposase [Nocardiopsis aegyptia]
MSDAERQRRHAIRLRAADLFKHRTPTAEIARRLRVSPRAVQRWHRSWKQGGTGALASTGPPARPRLDTDDQQRLEAELAKGPTSHGWDDQRCTLARIRQVICTHFDVGYTLPGVWYLLRRMGWSFQQPAHRSTERDDAAIQVWKKDVWPAVNRPRRPATPGSSSRTKPGTS